MATADKPSAGKPKKRKKLNNIKGASRSLAIPPNRASVYDPERHPERARRMGLLGLNDVEMCFQLGISEPTFYAWQKRHPAFLKGIQEGKSDADERVAESLYKRAAGTVRLPAVKVFYDKDNGEPVYAPYVEHLPPDVGAAKLWLTNRQPQKWRERREIEVSGSLEHRIAQMSPDERLARLKELQAKASLIIEGGATEVADDADR